MSNIINVNFGQKDQQESIDDIGAQAFLYIRDSAEDLDIPIKDVIVEHILGLAMVMAAVEGGDEARRVLNQIINQI